jgi:CO/xanthine dehydrogenase FAD-binding subunit
MLMQSFAYVAARTLDEAVDHLATPGRKANMLAGGTDLIVQLREGRRTADLLVDIKSIPETNLLIYHPDQGLTIGAAVSCQRICRDPAVVQAYPGIVDAVSLIGGTQIQGRATVGGNLCNASPAADTIPTLISHQAVCTIYGPHGSREVAAEDFCTAPGRNVLLHGEFLVSIRVPPPPPGFGANYLRFIPRNEMDIAVAGAGVSVLLGEGGTIFLSVRSALSAVAPVPLFVPRVGEWLAGQKVNPEMIHEAGRIAQEAALPIDDMRGTAIQRKRLAAVLTRRALENAVRRARN